MDPKRYQIFWADLNPTKGGEINKTRPVVVISPDSMNRWSEVVIVCPITSSLHPQWKTRVQIKCAGKDAEIAVDQLRSISKSRLIKKVDTLKREAILELRQIIQDLLIED